VNPFATIVQALEQGARKDKKTEARRAAHAALSQRRPPDAIRAARAHVGRVSREAQDAIRLAFDYRDQVRSQRLDQRMSPDPLVLTFRQRFPDVRAAVEEQRDRRQRELFRMSMDTP
jgi:hypothetical protein